MGYRSRNGFNIKPFLIIILCLLVAGLSLIGADSLLAHRLKVQKESGAVLSAASDDPDAPSRASDDPSDDSTAVSDMTASTPAATTAKSLADLRLSPEEQVSQDLAVLETMSQNPQTVPLENGEELLLLGSAHPSQGALTALSAALDKSTEDQQEVGFLMMDLATGRGVAYHPTQLFFGASSVKAPFVVSLVESNPASADERPQSMLLTLQESDNASYTFLSRTYGREAFQSWWTQANLKTAFDGDMYIHYTTEDLARLWLLIYRYLETGPCGDLVGSWMEDPTDSSIHRVLGDRYPTHSKGGWNSEGTPGTCDAGIVYAASPYLLVVMSDYPEVIEMLDPFVEALEQAHQDL